MAQYDLEPTGHRVRTVRADETALWIAVLDVARIDARRMASGQPLDTASKDTRRHRWQLTWDVANFREWMASSDEGGLVWIASVLDAVLGCGSFDRAGYEAELSPLLAAADAHVERLAALVVKNAVARGARAKNLLAEEKQRHAPRRHYQHQPQRQLLAVLRGLCPEWDEINDAILSAEAVSCPGVQGHQQGGLLRGSRGQGAHTVAARGQRQRRQAVAQDQGQDSAA